MSDTLHGFTVTVPAGTPIDTPYVTSLIFPPAEVVAIEARVPPGPNGNMGFQIGSAGVQVVPFTTGEWIVATDEAFDWQLVGLHNSGAWTFTGYNVGNFDHSVQVRFHVAPPGTDAATGMLITPNPGIASLTS